MKRFFVFILLISFSFNLVEAYSSNSVAAETSERFLDSFGGSGVYNKDTEFLSFNEIVGKGKGEALPNNFWDSVIRYFPDVKQLYISAYNVPSVPQLIQKLKSLKSLSLIGCNVEVLPASIGKLTSLEVLNLGNNKLKKLPKEIGDLKKLESLYLNENKLSSLPVSIGNLKSLEMLNLSHNNLKKLHEKIRTLKKLNYLNLTDNQFPENYFKNVLSTNFTKSSLDQGVYVRKSD